MAKKVLFINQEIDPYVAETHMSIMGRELPQKMQEAGFEIRTFMPKWGTINERRGREEHSLFQANGTPLSLFEDLHAVRFEKRLNLPGKFRRRARQQIRPLELPLPLDIPQEQSFCRPSG